MNLKNIIETHSEINYSLEDLLINCGEDDIKRLIYHLITYQKIEKEKEIIKNMFNKIYKILPQDIIAILPDDNIIKEEFFYSKIYDFNNYLKETEIKKKI